MKRRAFVHQTTLSAALLAAGSVPSLLACERKNQKRLTVLHTNDVHSHIEPFPSSHPQNPNQGGVARRATLLQRLRAENPNTLLLDAGDIFQGTPYFNFYGGELEFKLMSMMQYDAATIGNHDFDNGIEGLYAQVPHANFKLLSANYDFSDTLMKPHVKPYEVFVKDTIRVGVFGLGIKLDGLVTKQLYQNTRYLDPIEIARHTAQILKEKEQCDVIICLSHLGNDYPDAPNWVCDRILAKETENIHLIIGGHTHTFMDKPEVHRNRRNEPVLINQVGCYGVRLGKIDFYLDADKQVTGHTGISIQVS